MKVLRAGPSSGLIQFDTAWFRMDLETLEKITRCAHALERSKRAFDTALTKAFEPEPRKVARAFLLRHWRPSAKTDGATDRSLSDFLAASKSLRFVDYRKPLEAHAQDRERMTRFASEEAPPPLFHPLKGAAPVRLPAVLRTIAEATFLNRQEVDFLNHRVGKRGVPSHGARHPFDAFLGWRSGSRSVEAYFDPVGGRAYRLARTRNALAGSAASCWIRLYASYERVQWRYRHSGFYDTLLLDAGHILANISIVASSLGWRLGEVESPSTQPHEAEPLLDEVFLEIELVRTRVGGGRRLPPSREPSRRSDGAAL
jgi:hypothetical protein